MEAYHLIWERRIHGGEDTGRYNLVTHYLYTPKIFTVELHHHPNHRVVVNKSKWSAIDIALRKRTTKKINLSAENFELFKRAYGGKHFRFDERMEFDDTTDGLVGVLVKLGARIAQPQ